MAPATKEELTEAAEAGAEAFAKKQRDSQPPGPASDPGQVGTVTKTTTVKKTRDVSRLTWPTAILVSSISMALGIGIAWGANKRETTTNSVAIKKLEETIVTKADKAATEKVEERTRAVENAATANTEQHTRLGEKVEELKTDVAALKKTQDETNRKLDQVLAKLK